MMFCFRQKLIRPNLALVKETFWYSILLGLLILL